MSVLIYSQSFLPHYTDFLEAGDLLILLPTRVCSYKLTQSIASHHVPWWLQDLFGSGEQALMATVDHATKMESDLHIP